MLRGMLSKMLTLDRTVADVAKERPQKGSCCSCDNRTAGVVVSETEAISNRVC